MHSILSNAKDVFNFPQCNSFDAYVRVRDNREKISYPISARKSSERMCNISWKIILVCVATAPIFFMRTDFWSVVFLEGVIRMRRNLHESYRLNFSILNLKFL
ncbi:MAG: hypothetical protein A2748_01490 [Candidatus Wildermuthbacteria bacterium RIFCSPHIGHO2_01_FULL_45_20]|uniref:Uncharacterized protein n=1 Tax=Candidatus Wildermuthbacteria bacterium RIFCSPHIGHO2_02_FULL_45_25 TaxID=1802450 RepID=A0A1G2R273_9BACT|nr:MAG: hypothetical protein A2748_01490 [Candidatus Wildermuthbacteria bacterium RIFCSPHIGHO2_01_FULL_45_20]OHA66883.1 MAG: hypothetical protein A3C04_02475 [Candidatus Wildermuthbacteria bacterium RIFCSPHIGHO2_02_FULL_45_25]